MIFIQPKNIENEPARSGSVLLKKQGSLRAAAVLFEK